MARGAKAEAAPVATREELTAAVKEVNTILGLEGADAVTIGKKTTDEEIITAIKAVADNQLYESDFAPAEGEDAENEGITFFSEAVDKTLELIGVEVLPGAPPATEEAAPVVEKAAKAGKTEKAPKAEKAASAPKADKVKQVAPVRYSRYTAFTDAAKTITKPISKEALYKMVSDQYVKGGGKVNDPENNQVCGRGVQILEGMGYLTVDAKGLFVFSA